MGLKLTIDTVSPAGDGTRTKTIPSFNGNDGSFVFAGVVSDQAGNLWGTSNGYGS